MCGINGFLYFKNSRATRERNAEELRKMNAKIRHRGPDESGIFADDFGGVGMTRLSIIDLKTGSQPIANEDGRLQIVFNGEIYNFREVRERLVACGHLFKTQSDTETILHAYEEFGEDCVNHLFGMFAFAIYDTRERQIFLARDRVGEKPLYYTKTKDRFIFASELKSILALANIPRKIDKIALTQFLTLTYIPAPRSIFEGIYKLPAAHTLSVSENGEISSREYWDVASLREEQIDDYGECKLRLRETLFSSVEKCMISDVPVGTFLSGGIDSTIITGIAAKISKTPVETFTIGLREKSDDESPLAKITSQFHGTKHHVHVIGDEDLRGNIATILEHMDEPFADSSIIPTYTVSKMARERVKVILTGDSGDELFAGYNKYLIGYYSALYNRVPAIIRKQLIERIVYALPDTTGLTRKIRKVLDNASGDIFEQRRALMCLGIVPKSLSNLVSFPASADNSLAFIRERYETGAKANRGG